MTIFSGHPVFTRIVFVLALTNLAAGLIYLLTTLYPADDAPAQDRQALRGALRQRETQALQTQVTVSGYFMGKTAGTVTVERTPTFSDDEGQVTGRVSAQTQFARISVNDFATYWCRWYQTLDAATQRLFPPPYAWCEAAPLVQQTLFESPSNLADVEPGDYLILTGVKSANMYDLARVWLIKAPATPFPFLGIETQGQP